MKINAIYKGKIEEAFFKDRIDAYKASKGPNALTKILEKLKTTPFSIPREFIASVYFRSGDKEHYEPESQINDELLYALNRNITTQNKDRIINYIAKSTFDMYSPNYDYGKFISDASSAVSFAPKMSAPTEPAPTEPAAAAPTAPTEPAAATPATPATPAAPAPAQAQAQAQAGTQAETQTQAPSAEPPQTQQAQTPQASAGLRRLDVLTALSNSKDNSGDEHAKDRFDNPMFTRKGNPVIRKASELKLRKKIADISGNKGFIDPSSDIDHIYNFLNSILDKIPIKDSKEYNEISLLREGLKELYHSATDPEYQQYITGEETNEKKEQIGIVHTIRKITEKMIEMYIQETDKILQTKGSNIQDYTRQLEQHMKSQKYAHKSDKARELAKKSANPGSINNYQNTSEPDTQTKPMSDFQNRLQKWQSQQKQQSQQANNKQYNTLASGGQGVNIFGESANFFSGRQFVFEADWYES